MKKIEMEGALCRAVNQAPLLDFEALAAIPVERMAAHDWVTVQRKKKINLKPISAVAASFLVGVVVYSGWFAQFKMTDSVIALDVNQSVEIITNRQNKVLTVRPLNEMGQKVLAGKDFNQADLNESVNIIITGLIEYGYLNESDKTIMVSVKNSDVAKADQLAESVSQTIEETADAKAVSPTILNQTYDKTDTEEETLAADLGVTTGKMNVMTVINQADSSLELETLAAMSMDQLIKVSEEKDIDLSAVIKTEESDSTKVKNSTDTSSKEETLVDQNATVPVADETDEESEASPEASDNETDQAVITEESADSSQDLTEPQAEEEADRSKESVDEKVTEDDQTPPDKTSQAVDKEDSLPDESNQQLTPEDPETDASGNAESQN
jgi:hypothetical protein